MFRAPKSDPSHLSREGRLRPPGEFSGEIFKKFRVSLCSVTFKLLRIFSLVPPPELVACIGDNYINLGIFWWGEGFASPSNSLALRNEGGLCSGPLDLKSIRKFFNFRNFDIGNGIGFRKASMYAFNNVAMGN